MHPIGDDVIPAQTTHTSRTITGDPDFMQSGILFPHEFFRWLNREITEIMKVFDPLEPGLDWMPRVFMRWFEDWYVVCVIGHHEHEEKIVNPFLDGLADAREKGEAGKSGSFKRVSDEHTSLIELMQKARDAGDQLAKEVTAETIEAFKAAMATFTEAVEDHLSHEEVDYPLWMKAVDFTEEDDKEMVNQILNKSTGVELARNLAGMIYSSYMWQGKEETGKFLEKMPPPPVYLLRFFWMPAFLKECKGVADSLKNKIEPATAVCC